MESLSKVTNNEMSMFGSVIWNKSWLIAEISPCKHQYNICRTRRRANILKDVQLTLSHICISVLVLYQHDDLFGDFFFYIMNALLFPTHLMCTRHSISERLRTYLWFQPGSVKFISFCKYSCIPFTSALNLCIHMPN